MVPERNISAAARLSRLTGLVPNCVTTDTTLTVKEMADAVEAYIKKLEASRRTLHCRCCGKPENEWLQYKDLEYLYLGEGICQACESIIYWSGDSPAKLELVAEYIRLLEKEQEAQ